MQVVLISFQMKNGVYFDGLDVLPKTDKKYHFWILEYNIQHILRKSPESGSFSSSYSSPINLLPEVFFAQKIDKFNCLIV